jgi:hypothetical protein
LNPAQLLNEKASFPSRASAGDQGSRGTRLESPQHKKKSMRGDSEIVFDKAAHQPGPVTQSADQNTMQRMVVFSESKEKGKEPIITFVWINRPEGTSSSGAHTTAISLFQQATMNAMLYHTYEEALHNLRELTMGIRSLPGYVENADVLEELIGNIENMIAQAGSDFPMNYGAWLDEIAKQYILAREKVPYTHHNKGEGESGGKGEASALEGLHKAVQNYAMGKRVKEEKGLFGMTKKTPIELLMAEKAVGLIDLRSLSHTKGTPYLEWVFKVATLVSQHLMSLYQAYPILYGNQLFRDAVITLCANAVGISPGDLAKAVSGSFKELRGVRSIRNVMELIATRFTIGHADGSNNECLLHTLVQLLAYAGVDGVPAQENLQQTLVEAGIIQDGQMIDVYNAHVTEALAALFHVRFQVHQVTPYGAVIDHPVIGNGGPVLHIMHYINHFTPLYGLVVAVEVNEEMENAEHKDESD